MSVKKIAIGFMSVFLSSIMTCTASATPTRLSADDNVRFASYAEGRYFPQIISFERYDTLSELSAGIMFGSVVQRFKSVGYVQTSMSKQKFGYGQGKLVGADNVPLGALDWQNQYGEYGYALSPKENSIILTFDQGYENGYTVKILDALKEKGVTAIFFLTGDYANKETALVNRMLDEGHILGNHGMKHKSFPTLSKEEFEQEIMDLHSLILDKYGVEMHFLRPPCGEFSEMSLSYAKEYGYSTMMWSGSHVDWLVDEQPDPVKSLEKLTNMAHSGAIYLLHSVSVTNADILGNLIDNLRSKGYNV